MLLGLPGLLDLLDRGVQVLLAHKEQQVLLVLQEVDQLVLQVRKVFKGQQVLLVPQVLPEVVQLVLQV